MSKISAFHQFWHDIQLDIFFVKDTLKRAMPATQISDDMSRLIC